MLLTTEIILPWPPTVNTYWRHVGAKTLISRGGREYRKAVDELVAKSHMGIQYKCPVRLMLEAYMPDKRRRDLDNLLKALLDSLVYAGMLEDDSQVDDLSISRARDDKGQLIIRGMVRATIVPLEFPA